MKKIITLILLVSTAVYGNTEKNKRIDKKINLILAKKSEFFMESVLQNIKGSFLVMDNKKEVMEKILNRDNGAAGSKNTLYGALTVKKISNALNTFGKHLNY